MTYFTDEVARILAGPMPRRQALKLLSGVLAGAFLSSIGIQRAGAQRTPCACAKGLQCCAGANGGYYCIGSNRVCCQGSSCSNGYTCCDTPQDSSGNYCAKATVGCSAANTCHGVPCPSRAYCCSVLDPKTGSYCVNAPGECPGSIIS